MAPPDDEREAIKREQHEHMLRLVARSFYQELIRYGVTPNQVLAVAGHLLDFVGQRDGRGAAESEYYNRLFSTKDIRDESSASSRRLSLGEVSLVSLRPEDVPRIEAWLRQPEAADAFHPAFPAGEGALAEHVLAPSRAYFTIYRADEPVGLIGADTIDAVTRKIEMRKLVGDSRLRGGGIGKQATFLFLHHAFANLHAAKVFVHSLEINVRNINLNGRFGFELEGVFVDEVMIRGNLRDVIRMALTERTWRRLFIESVPA